MSIRVPLQDLPEQIRGRGVQAYLITVGETGPKVVALHVVWDGDHLRMTPGGGSIGNVAVTPSATLLWPAANGEEMSLLVDGTGLGDPDTGQLRLTPTSAILHITRT